MASPIIVGNDEPIFQFWEQNWKPWAGGETSNTWQGFNITKMSTLAQTYLNAGYGVSLKFEKNIATLVIKQADLGGSPGSQFKAIIDKWEVAVDQERPELFQNQTFLSIVQANDNAFVTGYNLRSKQIIQAMKSSLASNSVTAWNDFYETIVAVGSLCGFDGTPITSPNDDTIADGINLTGTAPNLKLFFDDYQRGATNFVHGKYSLKHTTIAPSNYASNVADFNVEQIYTISALLSECQDRTLWILPLPGYLAYKILNYPVPSAMPPNFEFGALKMRANATVMARGRVEIQTEYLIDAWPIHTYGLGPQ